MNKDILNASIHLSEASRYLAMSVGRDWNGESPGWMYASAIDQLTTAMNALGYALVSLPAVKQTETEAA